MATQVHRLREYQVHEKVSLYELLDSCRICHVGIVRESDPVVIPTAFARSGDSLLLHGSTGSYWMREAARGRRISVAVTRCDAFVVARSTFESSFQYRSAVMFGIPTVLTGTEKLAALTCLVEHFIPGRMGEVRESQATEVNRTMVLSLPIDEWSLKCSPSVPDDKEEDLTGNTWAGTVPIRWVVGPAIPSPDLKDGIPIPRSVRSLMEAPDSRF